MTAHVCPENSFSERRLIPLYRENARTSCSSTAPNTIAHFLRLTGGMCIIFYERKNFLCTILACRVVVPKCEKLGKEHDGKVSDHLSHYESFVERGM